MANRPRLAELADRYGILPVYTDLQGVQRFTTDAVGERLLSACGVDASTEEAAGAELARLEGEEGATVLAPVQVRARNGYDRSVPVRWPVDWGGGEWRAEFVAETGGAMVREGRFDEVSNSALALAIPDELDEGYHDLRLTVIHGSDHVEARQSLILTPSRCLTLGERIGEGRAFGVWTNLYSIRSETNWGAGDLADLRTLACEAGRHGADFVGINPLHATSNRGAGISPYSPVSRLFRNPVYLDIEAVPDLADAPAAQELMGSAAFQDELRRLRSADCVDYERVVHLKLQVMRLLYAGFVERESRETTPRGAAFRDYVARQGEPLRAFARYVVDRERVGGCATESGGDSTPPAMVGGAHPTRWGTGEGDSTPPPMVGGAHPTRWGTREHREEHKGDVEFHCYVQFELDRQLAEVQAVATRSGMRLGLYNDLALGAVADGSDARTYPDLFVDGLEVGAPPDAYSAVGQKWGFPPINPHRLRTRGYDYWIGMLRSSMAHAGLLRLDHVMGLFRQFWVPREDDARGGAYVRYPAEDLLGILALESRRNGTVMVGEDLGTVPSEVPLAMERYGILSSRLMIFEREWDGSFRPPGRYTRGALVMATNHDYPPLAGLWEGRDIQVRQEHGLIDEQAADGDRTAREQLRIALVRALGETGVGADIGQASPQQLCRWVYAFLARTDCRLLGVSLDDLAGEVDPVNLPGVAVSEYPSWTRRMGKALGEVLRDETFRDVLDGLRRTVRGGSV